MQDRPRQLCRPASFLCELLSSLIEQLLSGVTETMAAAFAQASSEPARTARSVKCVNFDIDLSGDETTVIDLMDTHVVLLSSSALPVLVKPFSMIWPVLRLVFY